MPTVKWGKTPIRLIYCDTHTNMFASIFTLNKQENFATLTCDSVKVVENFNHVKILSAHAQVQIKRRIGL